MNWDMVEGKWSQIKGAVREKWGDLTDDEIEEMAGKRDQVIGKLQQKYGIAKEEAEQMADDFASSLEGWAPARKLRPVQSVLGARRAQDQQGLATGRMIIRRYRPHGADDRTPFDCAGAPKDRGSGAALHPRP